VSERDRLPAAVRKYVDRLIAQRPIAIIQYGSSVRQEDYVPGVSDVDLLVVSKHPLRDVANDVGSEYLFVHPNNLVAGLGLGSMFWLSAMQSGRVLYDPDGFIAALLALEKAGFEIKPGLVTLKNCLQLTDMRLTEALCTYFQAVRTEHAATKIASCLYSAAKGIGGFYAIASTGQDPHGFSAIKRAVAPWPALADLMQRARDRYHAPAPVFEDRVRTRVHPDEPLGAAILEVEQMRQAGFCLIPGRQVTNDLIDRFVATQGPIDQCLRVHVSTNNHVILGCVHGQLVRFGMLDTIRSRPSFACDIIDRPESFLSSADGNRLA
jgi:hypothetical protein